MLFHINDVIIVPPIKSYLNGNTDGNIVVTWRLLWWKSQVVVEMWTPRDCFV